MGLFGSIKKAIKKVVSTVTGKGSQEAPKVEAPAPEVENPKEDTPEVEIGTKETSETRRRKGKKSLRIDREDISGVNIV